jgi:hypothetical protein
MPQQASEVAFDDLRLKIMLVGPFGSGKSTFCSSIPGSMYVFDFDEHILGYRDRDDVWFDQFPMSPQGWVKFEKIIPEVGRAVREGKYDTVVVDSLTSMGDIAMERAMQIDPKRGDDEGPIWNVHYGIVKNIMSAKLHIILSWPCNVIFNSHWGLAKDKQGNIISADPMLTGQLSVKIPGLFDEVYSCEALTTGNQTKYYMNLITKGVYKARSLISGKERLLPDRIPNDYNELRKHIDGLISSGKLKSQAKETNNGT